MRKLIILLLIISSCTTGQKEKEDIFSPEMRTDTTSMLYQYWILQDAEHPLSRDVINKENNMDFLPGIVFMNDGGILENPGGITFRGTYQRNGTDISVTYENGTTSNYTIQILNKDTLFLKRKIGADASELLYSATNAWWPDIKTNPFTRENFAWTIKPAQAESQEAIKKRCVDYIRFCQYYIDGHVKGAATKINFVGLPNIFKWYSGGIGLEDGSHLNAKWVNCFYNPEDADKGYAMIRHAILKKYKWDTESPDWMSQSVKVLAQMRDSL